MSWNGNASTFTPSSYLAYDTSYYLTVTGKDPFGNLVTASWSFTTIDSRGNLTGTIEGSGGPIANAMILLSNGMMTTTDASGHFVLKNMLRPVATT